MRARAPGPAGVADALEQQREFDDHVVETKRYAFRCLFVILILASCFDVFDFGGGVRIAELAKEGQRAKLKLKSTLAMQESLAQRVNDLVGLMLLCVRSSTPIQFFLL